MADGSDGGESDSWIVNAFGFKSRKDCNVRFSEASLNSGDISTPGEVQLGVSLNSGDITTPGDTLLSKAFLNSGDVYTPGKAGAFLNSGDVSTPGEAQSYDAEIFSDAVENLEDMRKDSIGTYWMAVEKNECFDRLATTYVVELPVSQHQTPQVIEAKQTEMKNLQDYNTFEEVEDIGQERITSRWVVTVKEDHDGQKTKC